MKAEDWLNKNCKASDWSESANQANDFIHTSDVIKYMEQYHESLVTLGLPSVSKPFVCCNCQGTNDKVLTRSTSQCKDCGFLQGN